MKTSSSPISDALALLAALKSCSIATTDSLGEPHTSYAPFIEREGKFYCFASELSRHTGHFLESGLACLLFIEDESCSKNIFARRRLTISCSVSEIRRDEDVFKTIVVQMADRLGDTVSILVELSDFHLFQFSPLKGNIVTGFGNAHEIDDLTKLCLNNAPC